MADEAPATGAPAAEPAATPVAPVTPAEPAAPVTPTPEETAQAAEDKEWDDATDEIFPGLKINKAKDNKPDEPAKPAKTAEEIAAEAANPENKGKDAESKPGDDAKPAGEKDGDEATGEEDQGNEPDTTARDTRLASREAAKQLDLYKADVRKQMFEKVPTVLQDADGDPINSVEDVMNRVNPRTGEAFTEEEAGIWLLNAQQNLNKGLTNIDKQIDQIAEVNMDIKDEADAVNRKYGELLRAMPEKRDEIWAEFQKTLIKDEDSGVIIKMPVSLEKFYDTVMEPYAAVGQKAEQDEATKAKTDADAAAAAEKAKADANAKAQRRADRSDIFGVGKTDEMDDEEKEWADAIDTVFPQINKKAK